MKRSLGFTLFLAAGMCGSLHAQAHAQARTGHFLLTIDGEPALLRSVDTASADKMTLELGVTPGVVDWLGESLAGDLGSELALVELDDAGNVISQLALYQTHITEISLPAMGGDKKDAFFISVQGEPSTKAIALDASAYDAAALEDSLGTVSFEGASAMVAAPRDISTGHASGKRQHKAFVITKEWGPASPQLEADAAQETGVFKLTPEKAEAGSEAIRRVKAELYTEQVTFSFEADDASSQFAKKKKPATDTQELTKIHFSFDKIQLETKTK